MSQKSDRKKEIAYRVLGSVLMCAALAFAALILGNSGVQGEEEFKVGKIATSLGAAALALFAFEILCFFRFCKTEGKIAFFRIAYAAIDLAVCVCAFGLKISEMLFWVGCILYLTIPVLKRVSSILRNHKKRNVVLNILICIINALLLLTVIGCSWLPEYRDVMAAVLVGLVMVLSCLLNVGRMALSNFNVELLRKIIRKTYAGEILFGLLLLVISFSLALTTMEPNIKSFGDALWYCFAVVTTIGFGDFAASSILGRILTVLLGIYGIIVVSIITSIIVNFYNEVKSSPDDEEEENSEKEIQSPEETTVET